MASASKRGLGCLVLVVLFFATYVGFWKWSQKAYEESGKKNDAEAVKLGPSIHTPVIAVVEDKPSIPAKSKAKKTDEAAPSKTRAYLVEHGDLEDFRKEFPDSSLTIPADSSAELNGSLTHWPADKDGWKMSGSFTVAAEGEKQLIGVKSQNKPPANADPEIGTEYREVSYRTDGKSIELAKVQNRDSEAPMRAGGLAMTLNIGFWICMGLAYAMFRSIYWFVKRFRLAN